MNRRKRKKKANRRADKHIENAWVALEKNNSTIALKEACRAVTENEGNPKSWNDCGVIFMQCRQFDEAEKALKNAIVLARDYAEAHSNLAELQWLSGREEQALRTCNMAIELAPNKNAYGNQLRRYILSRDVDITAKTTGDFNERSPSVVEKVESQSKSLDLNRYNWVEIIKSIEQQGYALLPQLFSIANCEELINLWGNKDCFEKTVELESARGYGCSYKFFRKPLPVQLTELRYALYERLVGLANLWQERLQREERYAETHQGFLDECKEQRQSRSAVILQRYQAPAFNQLHQDVWGQVSFPFQLALTLSPRRQSDNPPDLAKGFEGGEFALLEGVVGKRKLNRKLATSLGDGVLFCTRHRLISIGGTYGLQSVRHGMHPMYSGERFVLGCPFHEYFGE